MPQFSFRPLFACAVFCATVGHAPADIPERNAEVQQCLLDDDTRLVEYVLGDERSHVWLVGTRDVQVFELAARSVIERAARHLPELLDARRRHPRFESAAERRNRVAAADAALGPATAELARLLLAPLAGRLGAGGARRPAADARRLGAHARARRRGLRLSARAPRGRAGACRRGAFDPPRWRTAPPRGVAAPPAGARVGRARTRRRSPSAGARPGDCDAFVWVLVSSRAAGNTQPGATTSAIAQRCSPGFVYGDAWAATPYWFDDDYAEGSQYANAHAEIVDFGDRGCAGEGTASNGIDYEHVQRAGFARW